MKEEFDKINKKIETLDTRLDSIDKTLIAQHESIKHHIYRSDLADERMDKFEQETKIELKEVKEDIEPIKTHVNRVDGALKLLGLIATIVGIGAAIYKLFV